jgi:hypothetical protein
MSDPYSFAPQPAQSQDNDVAGQWRNFLADNNNRAALLQFGLSMMQPMDVGQSAVGQLGQSIGEVGELSDRRKKLDIASTEADSKQNLRASQAEAAEARANTAATRAAAATDRQNYTRENTRLRVAAQLYGQYESYRKNTETLNARKKLLDPTAPLDPVLDFETWASRNPGVAAALGGGELTPSGGGLPPAETPPVPNAVRDPQGRWVVQKNGKWFEVK